jgi:hypothetical protein
VEAGQERMPSTATHSARNRIVYLKKGQNKHKFFSRGDSFFIEIRGILSESAFYWNFYS